MAEGAHRPTWIEVDLDAIEHNASVLAAISAPARLCAVVKADGYGHGAVEVAAAALSGGATTLAVAIMDEGVELRDAGIEAPIIVLAEPSGAGMAEVYDYGLTPTIYTAEGLTMARKAAARAGRTEPAPVEVKVDTGMHRVGADPADVRELVRGLGEAPELAFAGLWTHLAVADEAGNDFTAEQLRRFEAVRAELGAARLGPPHHLHACNTAGAIAWPAGRYDMVRCGIGLYGYAPSRGLGPLVEEAAAAAGFAEGLRPAMSWRSRVSLVRRFDEGERLSYGLVSPLPAPAYVATVPLGYADGIPRSYFTGGGEVLVNGVRRRLAGTVTMDQIVVDCGDDSSIAKGDEVVLIGRQGDEALDAEDWARVLGTISYEVVTRIGPRVPRSYRRQP
jgi:alanine racemase